MLVAALDTATLTLSCAILEVREGVELLASRTDRPTGPGTSHSVRLPGALVEILAPLGRTVRDVEGWAVGIGPGSFTGLRIGLASFKGLAYANRRPIIGVSSLAAMAAEAAATAPAGALLVPLLDARKGEVYAGYYRRSAGGVEAVRPEEALPPAALPARLSGLGPAVAFGEGYAAQRGLLAAEVAELAGGPATPGAEAVGRVAASRLRGAAYDEQALFALEPHYVRPSEAEVKFPHGFPPGPRA